jgi:hypothetical protein
MAVLLHLALQIVCSLVHQLLADRLVLFHTEVIVRLSRGLEMTRKVIVPTIFGSTRALGRQEGLSCSFNTRLEKGGRI